jgi:hypothetical protein
MAQITDTLPLTLTTTAAATVIAALLPSTIRHTDAGTGIANMLQRADAALATTVIWTTNSLTTPRVTRRASGRESKRAFGTVVTINHDVIDTAGSNLVSDFRLTEGQALVLATGVWKQIDVRVPSIPIRHRKDHLSVKAGRKQVPEFRTGILIGQTTVAGVNINAGRSVVLQRLCARQHTYRRAGRRAKPVHRTDNTLRTFAATAAATVIATFSANTIGNAGAHSLQAFVIAAFANTADITAAIVAAVPAITRVEDARTFIALLPAVTITTGNPATIIAADLAVTAVVDAGPVVARIATLALPATSAAAIVATGLA